MTRSGEAGAAGVGGAHRAADDGRPCNRVGVRGRRFRVAVLRELGVGRRQQHGSRRSSSARCCCSCSPSCSRKFSEGGLDSKALALLGVLSALGAAVRPLGAGTAGVETIFFLLDRLGSRARARLRLQPGLHDAVRVGAHHERRRSVDAVPDVRVRMDRPRRRLPAAPHRPARDRDARRLRRGLRVLLRPGAQPLVLAVHHRRGARASRSSPAPRSSRTCTATRCSTSPRRSAGTPAARSPNAVLIAARGPRRARRAATRRPQSLVRRVPRLRTPTRTGVSGAALSCLSHAGSGQAGCATGRLRRSRTGRSRSTKLSQ